MFYLALPSAWETQQWTLVERWSLRALELSPRHPVLNHNLAVLYSNIPNARDDAINMLNIAIEEDPSYARARLTLSSCLIDAHRSLEAIEHLDWIIENDSELRNDAQQLKTEINRGI